jgi:hypothetical protein
MNREGRLCGLYRLSDRAQALLLAGEAEDMDNFIEADLTVDGQVRYPEDAERWECDPLPNGLSVVIAGMPYADLPDDQARLGHVGPGLLHLSGEVFIPTSFTVTTADYADFDSVVAEVRAAAQDGGAEAALQVAAQYSDRAARELLKRMEP